MRSVLILLLLAVIQQPASHFTTPLTLLEMQGKQAVVETSQGPFIIEFLPEAAPNHVGYFLKLIEEGAFDGTRDGRLPL